MKLFKIFRSVLVIILIIMVMIVSIWRIWLAPLKCFASMVLVLQKPVTQSATQWLVADSLQAIDQEEQWEGELGTRWRLVL